ncbi:MAG: hypothetical protein ACI4EO_01820 [Blautia sp.]
MTRRKMLEQITYELEEIAEKEAMFLFRTARRAEKHGCSWELIEGLREEGFWLHDTAAAYPDRLVHPERDYKMKYAFKVK